MPRDLFGDVSDPRVRVGSRKWYTVPLSLFVHTLVLLLVVVIPLIATGALPDPRRMPDVFTIVEPAIPPPPPGPACRRRQTEPQSRAENPAGLKRRDRLTPEPPDSGFEPDVPGSAGVPGGSVVDGSPDAIAPPPPPPPVKPPEPVRIGGNIRAPERIRLPVARLPANRAGGADPGRRDHRSDYRYRWPGDQCTTAAISGRCSTRLPSALFVSGPTRRRRSTASRCRSS